MTIPLFVVYLRPALTLQTSLVEIRWVTSRGRCLLKLNSLIVMPSDAPHIPDPILPADCCRRHHCTHGRSWCMCSSASHQLPVLRLASALQLRVSRRRRAASTVVLAACTLPVWICTVPLLGRGLPEILGASTGESHPKGPFNIQSVYWPATTHCFPNPLVRLKDQRASIPQLELLRWKCEVQAPYHIDVPVSGSEVRVGTARFAEDTLLTARLNQGLRCIIC